jgi:hypothetical protein
MKNINNERLKIRGSGEDIQSDYTENNTLQPRVSEIRERQLMLRLEKLADLEGLRMDRKIRLPTTTQTLIDNKANESEVLKIDGSNILEGPFIIKELSNEPGDPEEGHAVIWMSDGTGIGDKGDIIIKITSEGVTRTATIVDYSQI